MPNGLKCPFFNLFFDIFAKKLLKKSFYPLHFSNNRCNIVRLVKGVEAGSC